MKIAVYGAGAIGGMVGARLLESGQDVSLIARGPHLAAIKADGLTVIENGKQRVVRAPATDDPADLGPQDCVLLALKTTAVADASVAMAPLMGPETFVLTAQNGVPWWYFYRTGDEWEGTRLTSVDADGRLWDLIGPQRAVGCVLYQAAEIKAPGVVEVIEHTAGNRFPIGEPDGSRSERVQALQSALVGAGFKSPLRPDIRTEIWVKLWGNLSLNPITALTGATLGIAASDAGLRNVAVGMMREGESVANALGVTMPISMDRRLAAAEGVGNFRTSMLQDLESGRPLELDALTGSIIELGRLVGVPTPLTDAIYALTKHRAIESGCLPS